MRALSACCAALLLAACGTAPMRQGAEPAPGAPPAPEVSAEPPAAQKKGGYYLDDGPGDSPPANLDAIPDAQPKSEPLHRFANNPYSVFGQDYVPAKEVRPFKQRGVASWYGRRFHGSPTSSGEPYDMYAMTAAHPTLPIPSYARVTNLANGRSVVVRINDRGPFHSNRVIDLSYTAAHRLGYVGKGSARVEVESVLADEKLLAGAPKKWSRQNTALAAPPAAAAPAKAAEAGVADAPIAAFGATPESAAPAPLQPVNEGGGVFVQLGAFTSSDNAESFRAHLVRELSWLADKILIHPKDGRFRLRLGPYGTLQEASRIAERVGRALDIRPLVVPH